MIVTYLLQMLCVIGKHLLLMLRVTKIKGFDVKFQDTYLGWLIGIVDIVLVLTCIENYTEESEF